MSVNADRNSVCAGDAVHVFAAVGAPPSATYRWKINNEPAGADKTLVVNTNNRPAGSYTVGLIVSAPGYSDGTGSATFTIEPYIPPLGTLTAAPVEILSGETSALSVSNLFNRCGGQIRVAGYSASEGAISGATYDSSTVRFDPSKNLEQTKLVTITATLKDSRGEGKAIANIEVRAKAAILSNRFPDIVFGQNDASLNDCAKRLLEDLRTDLDRDPSSKVLLVGHTGQGESPHLDERRLVNAADLLTSGKGIGLNVSPSRVLVQAVGGNQSAELRPYLCSPPVEERGASISQSDTRAPYRRVEVWLIPTGAPIPGFAAGARDATSIGVGQNPKSAVEVAPPAFPPSPIEEQGTRNPVVPPQPPPTTGTPGPAPMSWWLKAGLIIALLFMLFGIWTAAARVRESGWLARLRPIRSRQTPAAMYSGAGHPVVVHDENGYALQVEIVVIHHFEERTRIEAFCNQLAQTKYSFNLAPPGFPAGSPRWQQHFLDALTRSDVALVVLTASSLGQEWMNWQIEKAVSAQRNRDIPIYVAVLDQHVFDVAHTVGLLEGMKWYRASPEDQTELKSLLKGIESTAARDLRCFISYSHLRRSFAEQLCADLNRAAVRAWMDVEGIPGGAVWKQKIAEAIETSTHVLFLLTPESVKSEQVMAEIDWAMKKKKTVMPIMEKDVELPFGLVGTQAISFASGYDAGFRRLLQDLLAAEKAQKTQA